MTTIPHMTKRKEISMSRTTRRKVAHSRKDTKRAITKIKREERKVTARKALIMTTKKVWIITCTMVPFNRASKQTFKCNCVLTASFCLFWLSFRCCAGYKGKKGHESKYGKKSEHGKKGGDKHYKKWGHKKGKGHWICTHCRNHDVHCDNNNFE